jgi:hypothetical protein
MTPDEYLIRVLADRQQVGSYLFELTDDIQGVGRGKGKS